jgi:hypothetical protein
VSTAMTIPERESFLADLHVGTVSVAAIENDRAPLAVPIWYDYSPATGVRIITGRSSRKAVAIERAGRFTLVAQDESTPYRYVSVEGAVVDSRPCELDRDLIPMAIRYLGSEIGMAYAKEWQDADPDDLVYLMRPERWLSSDLTAAFVALTS